MVESDKIFLKFSSVASGYEKGRQTWKSIVEFMKDSNR